MHRKNIHHNYRGVTFNGVRTKVNNALQSHIPTGISYVCISHLTMNCDPKKKRKKKTPAGPSAYVQAKHVSVIVQEQQNKQLEKKKENIRKRGRGRPGVGQGRVPSKGHQRWGITVTTSMLLLGGIQTQ